MTILILSPRTAGDELTSPIDATSWDVQVLEDESVGKGKQVSEAGAGVWQGPGKALAGLQSVKKRRRGGRAGRKHKHGKKAHDFDSDSAPVG